MSPRLLLLCCLLYGCPRGHVVACTSESDPAFCARLGAACGALSGADNCGKPRTVASGGGVCSCAAEADAAFCARLGATCGALSGNDNCGAARTVASCGTCSSGSC